MHKTPEHLTRQFGIPADQGRTRAVPRVFFGFRGEHKSKLLCSLFSMTVAGALPEQGQKRRWSTPVTQGELAAMNGLSSRSTFTRRVNLLYRRPETEPGKPRRRSLIPFLNRLRQFASPNRYSYALPEQKTAWAVLERTSGQIVYRSSVRARAEKVRDERNRESGSNKYMIQLLELPRDSYHAPTLDQLAGDQELKSFWNPEASGCDGHGQVPRWIWDRRLPLSDTARLVMSYYFQCGLLGRDREGKVRGEIHPYQPTVAAACGISRKSVYNANKELERLKLIRVVQDRGEKDAQGKWHSGPAKIVYLPIRCLTHEEADRERQRFRAAAKSLQDVRLAARAESLHEELLASWAGREHALGAFWKEVRRKLLSAGLPRSAVRLLIPRPPD